jgi:hypothetical protein
MGKIKDACNVMNDDPCNISACDILRCFEKAGKSSTGYKNWEEKCLVQLASLKSCCLLNKQNILAKPTCAFEWKRTATLELKSKTIDPETK